MSSVKPVVQQATTPSEDRTQRLSTKTRIGVSSLIGGTVVAGAGAAALHLGKANVPDLFNTTAGKIADFINTNVDASYLTQIKTYAPKTSDFIANNGGAIAAVGSAFALGAVIGGATGKFTAHQVSLNGVKESLGVTGSDLNFNQIHRVADITVDGGIFAGRSTVTQFKDDVSRIRNLNNELTNTEFSLSSNAHNTSKARGTEDRFFDFEGARLSTIAVTTGDYMDALDALKSAVNTVVKATDKYTFQQGNSSTAINRREYILAGIMGHAHARGIAGNFLAAAVKERAALAETNPQLADANFRQALQKAIASGILAPNADPKCYEGMVNAAALASTLTPGKNPDSAVSSIFSALKDAGLIDSKHKARFFDDVHRKLENPNAEIVDPTQGESTGIAKTSPGKALFDRLFGKVSSQESQDRTSLDDSLDGPLSGARETDSQKKARLAAEAEAKATENVNQFADKLLSIFPLSKDLGDLYEKLIQLLTEKSIPLDQITAMDARKLQGTIAMRHKHGFDLLEKYEANDAAIVETREKIETLTDEIKAQYPTRPEDFDLASKEQKKAARAVLAQNHEEVVRINTLKAKAVKLTAKIDDVQNALDDGEAKANEFLFSENGEKFGDPAQPEAPGFFQKLFASFQNNDKVEETLEVEEEVVSTNTAALDEQSSETPALAQEESTSLEEPVQQVQETEAQTAESIEGLPEPIVVETKSSLKFW